MAVNRMTGHNQYRCHFCEKMCRKTNQKCPEFSKHARYHRCETCDVYFAIGPACRVQGARFAVFDPNNKDNIYTITVNYKKKKTKIHYLEKHKYQRMYDHNIDMTAMYGYQFVITGCGTKLPPGTTFTTASGQTFTIPDPSGFHIKELLTLDKAVKDITPKNALEKIKMYILFS
jgi:hypothetical protein